ncbi:MAG TPA: hypothetical protein VNJ31_01910 [Methyloceanibacter sp.]|nr:hypothetical protein [Methyloceanibacter sp.]
MRAAAVAIAALVIVGLGVWSSDPVQKAMAPADAIQERPPTAEQAAAERAAAEEEKAAAEDEAAAAEEKRIAAADEAAAVAEDKASSVSEVAPAGNAGCCKQGDTTPPLELVKQVPPGGLHNPYDWRKLAKEDPNLVKQFRLPGCNECHGGTGGGGFCPALSQGVWFWGNTDDVLFRLIALGSADLEKQGFERIQWGTVHAPMPMMGHVIKTSDHLWKIVAFIRSINPAGSNPPEKVVEARYKSAQKQK